MGLWSRLFSFAPDSNQLGITGDWEGHYAQNDDTRPIKAALIQSGTRISGTMIDVQTDIDHSLFDYAAISGLPPGADETLDSQIRPLIPGAGQQPILARTILPSESRIEGTINGSDVRFEKQYQGRSFHGFEAGDKRIGQYTKGHAVCYSGRLSSDGRTIEGKWTIAQPGMRSLEGPFLLRKLD